MKKLNVKLLAYVTGALALLAVGLFLVHLLQAGRIASALLWQARHAEEKGDLKETARFLKRYLEFEPTDLEERAHLGRTLADPKLANNYRAREGALFVLDQVVNQDPERHDLRRPLARVAIELAQYDLAREHLNKLKEKFPRDGEVENLFGQLHEARSEYARAEKHYRQSIELSPRKTDYRVRLALLLRHRQQKTDEALKVVEGAEKVAPDDATVLLMAATLAQEGNRLKKAWACVHRGLRLYPKDANFYKAQAGLLIREDKKEQAIACLRRAVKKLPAEDHGDLLWTLTNLLLDFNDPAHLKLALAEIARIRKGKLLPAGLEYLDARVHMNRGDWARAARLLERIRPKLDRAPELTAQVDLFLGQCYDHLDDPGRRLAAYERASGRDKSGAALLGLASAQWAMGRLSDAEATYEKAVALGAPEKAWVEYARLLIERNRQAEDPNWEKVQKVIDRARATFRDSVDLSLLRADALAAQDRFGDAEDELAGARQRHPETIQFWTAAVLLAKNQGRLKKAWGLLRDAEARFPDRVELRLARAGLLVKENGAAAGKDLEKLADNLGRLAEPDKQDELLRGLAEAYFRIDDSKAAARLLARAGDLPPNRKDLRLRLRLFDLYLQAEDEAGLARVLGQIRAIEGEQGTWWRFARSSFLIWQAKGGGPGKKERLEEARQLLEGVAAQRPSWSAVLLARAQVEDLLGNQVQARGFYRRAMDLGESNRRVVRQLVQRSQALAARGERSVEAEQKLNQAVELAPTVPEVWLALVQYYAATQQDKLANRSIESAEAKFNALPSPQREEALLALGQCYEAVGRPDKAEDQVRSALGNRSVAPSIVRGAAGFYMRAGFPGKAEPLLRALLKPESRTPPDVALWARHALAMVLSGGGDYAGFQEALKLVGLSLDERTGTVAEDVVPPPGDRDETERARARVLASPGIHPLRLQAVRLLTDLQRRGKLRPEDKYFLAELYDAEGKAAWPEAEKVLTSLVAKEPDNPAHLGRLAQTLLNHDKVRKAEAVIARLAQMEKDRTGREGALGSTELKARALELKGEHARAKALLQVYAAKEPVNPERVLVYAGYLARRRLLGEALDQCDRLWGKAPPELLGGACVGLLRLTDPAPEHCDRVERRLRQALAGKGSAESPVLWVQLADLLDLRGRYAEAEAIYRRVIRADERGKRTPNLMALNNLAWLLAQRAGAGDRARRAEEARDLIGRAINVMGPRPELLDTRAAVHLARGDHQAAVADLERATRDAPTPSRYYHLARALLLARQTRSAREAFQKAKDSGLEPKRLHPAERMAYRDVADELQPR